MGRRRLVAAVYLSAVACALLDPSALGLSLAAGCIVVLSLGYRFRVDFALVLSPWFLYLPFESVLAPFVGPLWGFLAAGAVVAVVSERLSLENLLSLALESPTGVDAEAKRLAGDLSRSHSRRVLECVALVAAIGGAAALGAAFLSAVSVLVLASVLLLIAVGYYASRPVLSGRTAKK